MLCVLHLVALKGYLFSILKMHPIPYKRLFYIDCIVCTIKVAAEGFNLKCTVTLLERGLICNARHVHEFKIKMKLRRFAL